MNILAFSSLFLASDGNGLVIGLGVGLGVVALAAIAMFFVGGMLKQKGIDKLTH